MMIPLLATLTITVASPCDVDAAARCSTDCYTDHGEDARRSLTLVNRYADAVAMVWYQVGAQSCDSQTFQTVQPDARVIQDTWVGHVWEVQDATTGAALLRYVVGWHPQVTLVVGERDAATGDDTADGSTTDRDADGFTDAVDVCPDTSCRGACLRCREGCPEIPPPPNELGLDPFYAQYCDAGGAPIVASAEVSQTSIQRAHAILERLLEPVPEVAQAWREAGIRVGIIGIDERTTEMPEYRDLYEAYPGVDWDERTRGLGATRARPLTSAGEENVLCLSQDRWKGESILVHELAHSIHQFGLAVNDGDFQIALEAAYNQAMSQGLWQNTYAATNVDEYWAEGFQSWFHTNLASASPDGVHNHVDTRAELQAYDPGLYSLIARYYDPAEPLWPVCP